MIQDCKNIKDVSVRVATMADVNDVMDMIALYTTEDESMPIHETLTNSSIQRLINNDTVLVGEYNGEIFAGIAGYVVQMLFSKKFMFSVMFIYVLEGYGNLTRKFINEVEVSLLGSKVDMITFGIPSENKVSYGKKLQRFFRIIGYRELETHFYKDIRYISPQ